MTDSALFTDEPLPKEDLFSDDPAPEWSQVGPNALADVKNLGASTKSLLNTVAKAPLDIATAPYDILKSATEGTPISDTPIAKTAKTAHEMAVNMPGAVLGGAKNIGEDVLSMAQGEKPENFIKHPVNEAIDLATFGAPLAGKLFGGAGAVSEGAEAIPKAPPIEVPPVAEGMAKAATPGIEETISKLGQQIPKSATEKMSAVGDYLANQYGQAAGKEGFSDTIAELLTRKAKTMRLREIGFSPGQVRKLIDKFGEEEVLKLADVAKEKGITKPIVGYKVGKNIDYMEKAAGSEIGKFRKLAAERGAIHNPDALVKSIREELDPIYLGRGTKSAHKGSYLRALEDIKSAAKDPDTLAKKLTEMNADATKNKMTQAPGAITDVANSASRANNNLIQQYLEPELMDSYRESLKDFGTSKLFKKGYSFKAGREFNGRSGPSALLNWAKDAFGNKFMENISEGLGNAIKKNPGIVKSPKVLMDEMLKQMSDTLDEIGDEFVQ